MKNITFSKTFIINVNIGKDNNRYFGCFGKLWKNEFRGRTLILEMGESSRPGVGYQTAEGMIRNSETSTNPRSVILNSGMTGRAKKERVRNGFLGIAPIFRAA